MIVNLDKFIETERPKWERLDKILNRMANDPWRRPPLEEVREMEHLYQRASADLARLATFSAEPETRAYLENLVARGYAEIHGGAGGRSVEHWRPGKWFAVTLPGVFRKRIRAFWFALALMLGGAVFGGFAVALDPDAKQVLMPFSHLLGDPAERVAKEESGEDYNRLDGSKGTFAGYLMTHNIRVTLLVMALGMTWGAGTLVLLFYNGVILGAVVADYVLAGQTTFLFGWLLPHGMIEIPAILVGGQAGFVLAGALIGRGQSKGLAMRLRAAAPDVVTLCAGAALMLVWAGVVEAFISQYHAPVLPYWVKIGLGVIEGAVLLWYLGFCGRKKEGEENS
ncbi:putative membrane protein SpoIIM required for sporulation [Ereboglobus sp. PH5-5]|uniref:stage II sporulation protein M n=1 Tax=unclassified Ereboglobus TaxID=2626932 RepID=UPI0024065F70|nr:MULTISPECIES: stage II sporulation protein M [unclassified Ereboglobus]MDF9826608.1 putative membrane protein SpoIIM required for sporulation [Ereboglobus sp. PH5-10]MDF9833512.1 putative membrane protein SpoIIM required for sporulation [Ereboglobus sp. PH5-5]